MKPSTCLKRLLAIILAAFTIIGCQSDDSTISIATSPAVSSTACRGRAGDVKSGPTDLNLPYPDTSSYLVTQSWFGDFSHYFNGGEHALDFLMDEGTIIYPVAAGRVIGIKEDSNTTCSSNCDQVNYVLIDHGDQVYGRYFHMCQNCVDVTVGQEVSSDTQIGRAGNTGWSTASHLHFELRDWEENCTVTYGFTENGNSATALTTGTYYTSTNTGSDSYTNPSVITGSTYNNVGVELTGAFSWYLASGSSITIQGNLTESSQNEGYTGIAVFLIDSTNALVTSPETLQFISGTSFNSSYQLPSVAPGTYYLGISQSFNGSYSWNNAPQIVIY